MENYIPIESKLGSQEHDLYINDLILKSSLKIVNTF